MHRRILTSSDRVKLQTTIRFCLGRRLCIFLAWINSETLPQTKSFVGRCWNNCTAIRRHRHVQHPRRVTWSALYNSSLSFTINTRPFDQAQYFKCGILHRTRSPAVTKKGSQYHLHPKVSIWFPVAEKRRTSQKALQFHTHYVNNAIKCDKI